MDEYLARTETVKDDNGNEIDYVDYYVNSNSCPGRIEVGVAWNDGDSDETKLEKIITQKWISMFPNGGYEAWTDFRRTGYPRLLPVPEENRWTGTPSFPVELQIRRIPNIYSVDYGFSLDNNLIGLDIYDGAQYIGITKKEGVSLNISNDSPDVAAAELICDEAGCKLKITPKGTGNAVIRVYSSSHSENLYVVVKDKLKFSANQVKMNVNGSSTIYLSVHGSLSQDKLETSLALLDGSGNDIMTQYAVNEIPSYSDSVKYEITFTAGGKAEELVFRAAAADRSIEIPIYVSYYTYLSFNTIDPADPGSNISSISSIDLKTNSSSYVMFYFYVEGDDAVRQEVTDAIADAANYTYEGSAPVIMGEPAVGPVGNGVYSAAFAVNAGDVAGDGTVTVNIFGEKLTVGVYIDDGERYGAVYISFTAPNTYTIPPTEMTYTASKTLFSDEPTFKIRVYHYVNPDVRAPYIDWNIEQNGDPVIMPTGRQVSSDYRYTDFEYLVSGEPGEAEIEFSVYNPQGEQGGDFAEYLIQTITAKVTVVDRNSMQPGSVKFNPDNIETNAAAVPLEAVMDPAVSVAAWPITYTVTEGSDIAEIVGSIDESSDTYYQLNIKKAGTIKVKAQAGEGDKEKSDELTVVAKLRLDQVMISQGRSPLEITSAPSSLYVGEEGTVTKLLHANYTVDESEFTWRSSNPDILSVDANGKVIALAEGTAAVIVEIKDDYNTYASDQREITVRTLSIDADISALPSDYYVVYFAGDPIFFVDTEEGSADYYTFSLDREILTADGTYTAGTDFNGTVTFPVSAGSNECEITGGTIRVSGGVATFNLTVSYEGATGTITGSKELLGL